MARKPKKFIFTRKLLILSAAAIVLIIGGSLAYWHYHNKPSQVVINVAPAKNTTPNQSSSADKSASTDSSSSDKSVSSSPTSSDTQNPTDGTSNPPIAPTGTFVSNHKPGQYNSPNTENSVCNTTPGASCYIEFTLGNTTLKLQPGIADSNGSVYWNGWNINNQGFTSGQWAISAVATLNGQTVSASDATPLIIQ